MKKILEIIPQLNSGGAERFVVDLCNELVKKNEVILIVLHSLKNNGFYMDELDKRVIVMSMNKKKGLDILLFWHLYKLIKKESPNIVHTHLRGILYSLLAYSLPHHKIGFIHTLHSDANFEAGNKLGLWLRKWAFYYKYVIPVTISKQSQQSFKKIYEFPSELIYNGRRFMPIKAISKKVKKEVEAYRVTPKTSILLNVARLSEEKNQVLLCHAVDELVKEGFDISLIILGGVRNESIKKKIEKISCERIHFLGEKKNPYEYMVLADAFCLSSIIEGMPITLIESFSVGLIPICTPVGGIIDMIQNGINGILSEEVSIASYKKAIMRFKDLSDNDRKIMQQNVLKSYEFYTIEECASKYIKLMD